MRLKKRLLAFSRRLHARIRKTRYMHKMRCLLIRSEERFSRNAETDLVCRLLREKKKQYEMCGSFLKSVKDKSESKCLSLLSLTVRATRSTVRMSGEESLSFFFNDTATTEIYTLSLHDALPISRTGGRAVGTGRDLRRQWRVHLARDRKSTRLNSSHLVISYAVFCLRKQKKTKTRSVLKIIHKKRQLHPTRKRQ